MVDMNNNKNIFVSLTYKCNAHCKKCMTRYNEKRNMEMSRYTFDSIIEKLERYNYKGIISMGTGEPLLYSDIDYVLKRILALNKDIKIRILTNGMALSNKLPSVLFGGRCKIGVTFDAFYQPTLKGLQRGVLLEQIKRQIRSLVQEYDGNIFYLNYTLYNNNIDEVIPFCEFAIECGIKEIYLTELRIFEGFESDLEEYRVIRNTHFQEIIESARTLLNEHSISTRGFKLSNVLREPKCYLRNVASPIIDVDGSVAFCSGHEDVYIGNITDDDIGKKWKDMAVRIDNNEICWCSKCHNNIMPNGTYSLPNTIKKEGIS